MKKIVLSLFLIIFIYSVSAISFAAESNFDNYQFDETNSLTNIQIYYTDGKTEIPFVYDTNNYIIDVYTSEGNNDVYAYYNSEKIILHPKSDNDNYTGKEYIVNIDLYDKKTGSLNPEQYTISGKVFYDDIQKTVSNKNYLYSKGVFFDFADGAENVSIKYENFSLDFEKTPKGILSFEINNNRNNAIDYMFSKHNLTYINFNKKIKLEYPVKVSFKMPANTLLYSYNNGVLKRESNTLYTDSLETFIISNTHLTEGIVDENKLIIK